MRTSLQWYTPQEDALTAPYPCGFIGDGITRGVALALPSSIVRAFLPAGLDLGEQRVTPPGTHPLVFLFHSFSHCQFSFPTLLPSMNFHEQTVGVPFTFVRSVGPYYFMPKLYLDDRWVLMVGRTWWGFDKELAIVNADDAQYTVTSLAGRPLVSLAGSSGDEYRAIALYPEFEPVRQMLSQPLISESRLAAGPSFTLTDFDRRWNLARVRPLRAVLDVGSSYLRGLDAGHYPSSELGSFELSAPWWLSFPYPPPLASRQASSFTL
jgi:hypothetical protein